MLRAEPQEIVRGDAVAQRAEPRRVRKEARVRTRRRGLRARDDVGARDERRLDRVSRTTLAISMTLMTLSGAFLFTFPAFMMSVFTRDPEVIAGGAVILRIVACSEPLYSAMIIFEGVFHGVGQTRYPFIVSLCTMWGVRVLGTILCVRVLGLGLWSAWMCMVGDNVTRAVLLSIRYIRGRWKRSLPLEPAAD